MKELIKCHLCDRKKSQDEMQTIKVNGIHVSNACKDHEIESEVMSYDFSKETETKTKK